MREIITLVEEKSRPQDIGIVALSYDDSDLNPVMSARTMEYHYGKLAHGYAERFNAREGDRDFNYAGAFLHNLFFPQFRKSRNNNRPNGPIGNMINAKFGSWEEFKQQFQNCAGIGMGISIQIWGNKNHTQSSGARRYPDISGLVGTRLGLGLSKR